MKLLTLNAERIKENGLTKNVLSNSDGKIVATYPPEQKQPHKNSKKIIHNGWTYNLNWKN